MAWSPVSPGRSWKRRARDAQRCRPFWEMPGQSASSSKIGSPVWRLSRTAQWAAAFLMLAPSL